MSHNNPPWRIWIDTGGTFTDCIAVNPDGNVQRLKVLSSSVLRGKILHVAGKNSVIVAISWPVSKDIFRDFIFRIVGTKFSSRILSVDTITGVISLSDKLPKNIHNHSIEITSNEEVPVLATRLLTETSLKDTFPVMEMKLGSTRGTNAILERKGARTALLVTKGFKDLLLIGTQQRQDLFAVNIIKQKPLYDLVIEVDERVEANGDVLLGLHQKSIGAAIKSLKKQKADSVAIALMNSFRNPVHEIMLSKALESAGFSYRSVSSLLSSQIKILPRAETSVVNAYLDPIIHNYVAGIERKLSGNSLNIMTSAGSLVKSNSFFPKDSLLSGPAGGVVGAARQATKSGKSKIIAFDMGGTSTDVSLYNNRFDYRFESRVGTFRILSPSLAIETIAAGGGSICDFDGHRLTVGPHSAGAAPGPACYGAGGPLTITDVNLLLGRIDPKQFAIPIDKEKSQAALDGLVQKVRKQTGKAARGWDLLGSFVQIANEKMAEAIKKISVQEGHDPREFTLLSFGGAGGQHACALADILDMKNVLVPYDAGLLSAYGIGHAFAEKFEEKLLLQSLAPAKKSIPGILDSLFAAAKERLVKDGHSESDVVWKKTLIFLRFSGQDTPLEIDYQRGDDILALFREKYIAIFGHWIDRDVEVESIRVIASVKASSNNETKLEAKKYKPASEGTQRMAVGSRQALGKIFIWEKLKPGASIIGPALVTSGNSTTFIEENWEWYLDDFNNAHLSRKKARDSKSKYSEAASLELFTNRFTALAQEMGALLQRTSFSVNVKERLDFSCAVLDPNGHLVVNAPHIPVHLGSMGVCVREVMKAIKMNEGDVIITNHPAFGGSHLPDVTLIKPVFYKTKLVGFVANRAHHAEIGGRKPGSMPADATRLEEEGVIIAPIWLVKGGVPQWAHVRSILQSPPYPTRSIEENLADLNGALAAVNLGERGLQQLCERHGEKEVLFYMTSLRRYASLLLSRKIAGLKKSSFAAIEYLDDGSPLQVRITKSKGRLRIDFTGSSSTHRGNLNATKAIVQSVVLYTLRLLVNQPLPMNEGLMEPVDLVLPTGLLNPDFTKEPLPAVVGGNTEVSQRLTDTLIKALGLAACSQGTMNNFLFGNEKFGYYETICGGTGAGQGFDGADAVHQHMTNTRITDPELMEFRYPVRLERFDIRKNSGGKGKWRGGDGIEREIFFKDTLDINLLTQHRVEKPYGLKGGSPGRAGEQFITRKDGKKEKLKGMDSATVKAGDTIVIKTPGGGGWGVVDS